MLRSGDGRAFAAAGILGIDRVSGVPVIFCSSSLAESRLCTHRTHVDHRIGLKIPFVAPAPCCTLGRAVLRRQDGQQQNCTIKSLVTVVQRPRVALVGPWCIRDRHSVQKSHGGW